jgi:hypothetical protein
VNYYSHSCKDNNSKHERSRLDVLLFDMSLFMVVTSQNGEMRRNWSTETASVRVFFPLPSYIKAYHKQK